MYGYDINWWKGDGKLLITYVSTKEKEKRYKSKPHWEKKKKKSKECKPKKYVMK